MSEFMKQALCLQNTLNLEIGRRKHPVSHMDDVLDRARILSKQGKADHIVVHSVPFVAILNGEKVEGIAEMVFAEFGQATETVWVAFGFYQDGWANAYVPYSADTAGMPWLDNFVTKELGG